MALLCAGLLQHMPMHAQCFGIFPFPGGTIVPDDQGAVTIISNSSFAGDRASVALIAGRNYRFTSSVPTDHITVSTSEASGALAFGTQPVFFTATTTQAHFIHFHTNAACGTQNTSRSTRVARVHCAAGAAFCGGADEAIVRVSIGTIDNITAGCTAGGYSDFSDQVAGILTTQSLPITVQNLNAFAGDQVHVFVDWDRDLAFDDVDGTFILSTTDNLTFSGNITAPPGTPDGNVLMRVRLTYTGTVPPCGSTTYGEVEDYTLNVGTFGTGVFAGGGGRGDHVATIVTTPIPTNVFSGGQGRGDVSASITPEPFPIVLFSGGTGRGDVSASIDPEPFPIVLFSGGTGRGDAQADIVAVPLFSNIYSGGGGRGDVAITIHPQAPPAVLLALRGFLEGPYSAANGLMNDALRTLPTFPLTEPYTALGYVHVGGGGESVAPAVLATTGNDAIVDWVVLELRDTNTPASVLYSRSALVQRDGDVVDLDGTSPVTLAAAPGTYHVAVLHRNHLGVMSALPVALGSTATALDLGNAGTPTFGSDARKAIGGAFPVQALWAGDVTFDGLIKYTGAANDRDPILQTIGGGVPTATVTGYHGSDVNMDGTVKYTGAANDRDPVLQNIGGGVPTGVRVEQVP